MTSTTSRNTSPGRPIWPGLGRHRVDHRSGTDRAGAAADEIAGAFSYLAGPAVSFVHDAVLAVEGRRTAV